MLFQSLKQCKIVQFYQQKKIIMLKLRCTFPNLADIFPHNWTNEKFCPFCEDDRDFCEKTREVMTGWTSLEYNRKAVLDDFFIGDSPNTCKSIVGNDASQLYPFSMCEDMSTGLVGATSSDSFLKAYKANETKGFSLTSGLTVRTSSRIKITSIRSLFQKTDNQQSHW